MYLLISHLHLTMALDLILHFLSIQQQLNWEHIENKSNHILNFI